MQRASEASSKATENGEEKQRWRWGWHCHCDTCCFCVPFIYPSLPLSVSSLSLILPQGILRHRRQKKRAWHFHPPIILSIHLPDPLPLLDKMCVYVCVRNKRYDSRGGHFVLALTLITLTILKPSIFHECSFACTGDASLYYSL